MKTLQVILTIEVSNDEYSLLLNKDLSLPALVLHALENDTEQCSFDFPAVIIDRLAD